MHTNSNNTSSVANGLGIGSSSSPLADKASKIAANASSEFHNFLDDIEDLIKDATTLTGEDLARAKAKLSERVDAAKQTAEAMGVSIAQRARQTATVTNEYVHEQPWKAIGAGAAVGLLIGFALARR